MTSRICRVVPSRSNPREIWNFRYLKMFLSEMLLVMLSVVVLITPFDLKRKNKGVLVANFRTPRACCWLSNIAICPARGCVDVKRSEEHTSELQSLMRISYAVFCLKKKTTPTHTADSPIPYS